MLMPHRPVSADGVAVFGGYIIAKHSEARNCNSSANAPYLTKILPNAAALSR